PVAEHRGHDRLARRQVALGPLSCRRAHPPISRGIIGRPALAADGHQPPGAFRGSILDIFRRTRGPASPIAPGDDRRRMWPRSLPPRPWTALPVGDPVWL